MIDVRVSSPGRRWWLPFLGVVVVLLAGTAVAGGRGLRPTAAARAVPPAASLSLGSGLAGPSSAFPGPLPSAPPAPSSGRSSPAHRQLPGLPPAPSTGRSSSALLQLPGPVPTRASAKFTYAAGRGPVLGRKGPLRRFRVAVERGSGEGAAAFAVQVEAILGNPHSWIGSGRVRLQRVGAGAAATFTVFLATRDTAGVMCARGGTNVRVGGVPYTSCRTAGRAIINLDRWRRSAKPYLVARVPLRIYRQYLINHEVGHELGRHHEGCPRRGAPAPVMVQQTLDLRGCRPNAWPRRGAHELSGPPV